MDKESHRRTFHVEQSPLEKARLWVEIVAFAAAGCWGLYTFVYQNQIAPAYLPAHEVLSVSLQRLMPTGSGTLERLQLTIRNNGTVDVDTAALVLNVFGSTASGLRWKTTVSPNAFNLHELKPESLHTLQSLARLLDGAIEGKRGTHLVLRPGDSFDIPLLVTVPHDDRLLAVQVDTVYARYPIEPRIHAQLVRTADGSVDLSTTSAKVDFSTYFGV